MNIYYIDNISNDLPYKTLENLDKDIVIKSGDNYLISKNISIDKTIINNGNLYIKGVGFELNGGSIINNGNIFFIPSSTLYKFKKIRKFLIEENISTDSKFTGFKADCYIENDFLVIITGPDNSSIIWKKEFNIKIGQKIKSPFYFSGDGGKTSKDKIEIGDGLYCNTSLLQTNLYKDWKLILIY
jgi:hypothetical protein